MATVGSGGYELAKLMANHVLGNIYRYMLSAIMDRNGVSHKGRENCRTTGPGPEAFKASIFFNRLSSAKGPFFSDLAIVFPPQSYLIALPSRLLTISLSEGFLDLRVL